METTIRFQDSSKQPAAPCPKNMFNISGFLKIALLSVSVCEYVVSSERVYGAGFCCQAQLVVLPSMFWLGCASALPAV